MPSSLQKLKEKCRSTSRRLSGSTSIRTKFTKRTESAPSCLYDVNMKTLSAKSKKPAPILTKTHSLKRGRRSGTTLPPPNFSPVDAPIPRSSLDLIRSSKRRRMSVYSVRSPCEECTDVNCLLCALAKPELKRRHSAVIEPSTFRNFF